MPEVQILSPRLSYRLDRLETFIKGTGGRRFKSCSPYMGGWRSLVSALVKRGLLTTCRVTFSIIHRNVKKGLFPMPTRYAQVTSTPQSVNTQVQPDMVRAAGGTGGYAFRLDAWAQLQRFLIMGAEAGTMYLGRDEVAYKNVQCVEKAVAEDGPRAVQMAVEISKAGRAYRNGPALYVVARACASADPYTKAAAFAAIPEVCRIGTHLFNFAAEVQELRGWGSGLKRAVGRWFEMPSDRLAHQVTKYQQRDGFSMADLLRLTHPTPKSAAHEALFRYMVAGADGMGERNVRGSDKAKRAARQYPAASSGALPALVRAVEEVKHLDLTVDKDRRKMAALVREHRLSHEMLPSQAKNYPEIWEALLPMIGSEALLRNLNKLAAIGMTPELGDHTIAICRQFTDGERLRKDRLHPMRILIGMRQYASGKAGRGDLTWEPSQQILRALDKAFYLSFAEVVPTGRRFMLGLDVSGSMGSEIAAPSGQTGTIPLTYREAAAALAMTVARSEQNWAAYGFASQLVKLEGFGTSRIDEMDTYLDQWSGNFGSTNPGLLFEMATREKIKVDCFVVLTDNDVNQGRHCHQLLKEYRKVSGIPAKVVVAAMAGNDVSIADPNDPGMLDTVGFDAALPEIVRAFAA